MFKVYEKMVEGLEAKVEGGAYGLKIAETGIFKDNLGKIKCAVCPKCGYTETYIEELAKVSKLKDKKNKSLLNYNLKVR